MAEEDTLDEVTPIEKLMTRFVHLRKIESDCTVSELKDDEYDFIVSWIADERFPDQLKINGNAKVHPSWSKKIRIPIYMKDGNLYILIEGEAKSIEIA